MGTGSAREDSSKILAARKTAPKDSGAVFYLG